MELAGDATYDAVRDAAARLGLGLVRVQQRRHRMAEVFAPPQRSGGGPREAGARVGTA